MEYQGERTAGLAVFGADDRATWRSRAAPLLRGRFFTPAELNGADVVVLEVDVAERLFGRIDPLGRVVRIGGQALRVIGIYQQPDNIFEPPGQEIGAVVPFETARQNVSLRRDQRPLHRGEAARPVSRWIEAKDLVTVALRQARNLRPGAAQHLRPHHPGPDPRSHRQPHRRRSSSS